MCTCLRGFSCPAIDWQPVQGVPCPSTNDSWDRLQTPLTLKRMDGSHFKIPSHRKKLKWDKTVSKIHLSSSSCWTADRMWFKIRGLAQLLLHAEMHLVTLALCLSFTQGVLSH